MPDKTIFTTLLLGDIYGDPGCRAISALLPALIEETGADFVIANGENACGGFGLTPNLMNDFFQSGVDVVTSGNHIWQQEEILPSLDSCPRVLRPANYPNRVPGHGWVLHKGIGVINLQGRLNLPNIDCPFAIAEKAVKELREQTNTIFVDCHAENSEEKEALAFFLDGQITGFVGTHTHVQTADEKILPNGTAYITDIGMTGPCDSVIGCNPQVAIRRNLTQMPIKAQVATTQGVINGVCIKSDQNGRALEIQRLTNVRFQ